MRKKTIKTGGKYRVTLTRHDDGLNLVYVEVIFNQTGDSSAGWIKHGSGYRAVIDAIRFHATVAHDLAHQYDIIQ